MTFRQKNNYCGRKHGFSVGRNILRTQEIFDYSRLSNDSETKLKIFLQLLFNRLKQAASLLPWLPATLGGQGNKNSTVHTTLDYSPWSQQLVVSTSCLFFIQPGPPFPWPCHDQAQSRRPRAGGPRLPFSFPLQQSEVNSFFCPRLAACIQAYVPNRGGQTDRQTEA